MAAAVGVCCIHGVCVCGGGGGGGGGPLKLMWHHEIKTPL